jgi:hypothetical protein
MDVPRVAGSFRREQRLRDLRLQRARARAREMEFQPRARLLGNRLSFEQQSAKRVGWCRALSFRTGAPSVRPAMAFRAYRLGARWRIVCKVLRTPRPPSAPKPTPITHQCQSVIGDYPRLFILA